jgi:hypothetical protein
MVARPSALPENAAAPGPAAVRAAAHVAEWVVDLDAALLDLLPLRDDLPACTDLADADDACGCSSAGAAR